MRVRLVRDVAWTTATELLVMLHSFGLKEEDRLAAFTKIRVIIEDGIKLFEERRRREQSRLARPEEPRTDSPEGPRS